MGCVLSQDSLKIPSDGRQTLEVMNIFPSPNQFRVLLNVEVPSFPGFW